MPELKVVGHHRGGRLALALWVALPVLLLVGSVQWDKVPPMLAAIHAGDWVLKLLIVTLIVTLWP